MGPPTRSTAWQGIKPNAWFILSLYWAAGAAAGLVGYWSHLVKGFQALPHLSSLDFPQSRLVLAGAGVATFFLKVAYIWASNRQGRPLSPLALVVFPLCNAVFEGFLLLLTFDAGRWLLSDSESGVVMGSVAVSALQSLGFESPAFFRQFMMGFIPYTLFYAVAWSYLWETWVLPEHMDPDAPNKFMRAIVMQQFAYVAVYWGTGDVVSYVAMRYVSELLTVVAARLPPPGVKAPEAPKQKAN